MFLIDVIPASILLRSRPQILTYFSAKKYQNGVLVKIIIGKRKTTGVVYDTHKLDLQKINIKKSPYQLKPLKKIVSEKPILSSWQMDLAKQIAHYYIAPLSQVIKIMIPPLNNGKSDFQRLDSAQTLHLVPTIHFINPIVKTYQKKYSPEEISIIHGNLPKKQEIKEWLKIKSGKAKVIIGTRIAVFAPLLNLKKIIIEEEENENFKSSRRAPYFDAKTVAKFLAEIFGAEIKFKSAAPSIETNFFYPESIFGGTTSQGGRTSENLKEEIIDMRDFKQKNFSVLSEGLKELLIKNYEKKGKAILFTGRRGMHPFLLCLDCGNIFLCPDCDAPLVSHLAQEARLICHHCGFSEALPEFCQKCQSWNLKAYGIGIQKALQEVKKLLPQAKILRLDSDIAKTSKIQKEIIKDFENQGDVLIATQMLFSWRLKKAGLAAMVSADTILHLPDFRSSERTFQTIAKLKQYASKYFLIQTHTPTNSAIKFALKNDYLSFYKEEIKTRQELSYPPFSQIIKLTFKHPDKQKALQCSQKLFERLSNFISSISSQEETKIQIIGPLPAFIPKEAKKYIWHIIIKITNCELRIANYKSQKFLSEFKNYLYKEVPDNWKIDVEPATLL